MKSSYFILIILASFLFLFGCVSEQADVSGNVSGNDSMQDAGQPNTSQAPTSDTADNESVANVSLNETVNGSGAGTTAFSGTVLAGTTSPYIRYNKADYDLARSEGKTIFLYFLANWCPICRADRPGIMEAFDELDDPDAVGFEVHYNDDETNSEDEAAARQFNVVYQHTAIIISSDGTESYRGLSGIDESTIISEISKAG